MRRRLDRWRRRGRRGARYSSCSRRRRDRRLGLYRWRYDHSRRMCRRHNHYRGRSRMLFRCVFFCWRRRNYGGRRRCRFYLRRCDHNTSFCCRSSRLGCNHDRFFYCRRRSRDMGLGNGGGWVSCHGGRSRFHRRGWLLLLLSLPEQLHHVAGLGNLGEIDLRLDLRRGSLLPGGRAGFSRQMFSYPFGLVLFNGA
jgi:hypothetical protein